MGGVNVSLGVGLGEIQNPQPRVLLTCFSAGYDMMYSSTAASCVALPSRMLAKDRPTFLASSSVKDWRGVLFAEGGRSLFVAMWVTRTWNQEYDTESSLRAKVRWKNLERVTSRSSLPFTASISSWPSITPFSPPLLKSAGRRI